ncbi:MAG: ATP-binding cassette domain-containing protein [bacterium]|nr:ATP-binding cassette domain-containing protein [bacterium]
MERVDEILAVSGLVKSYGGKRAVDDLSFVVRRGEVMGLLGPNGAGKTTAIRIIMGILAADKGRVTFCFSGNTTAMDKSRIGYLPEERGLYDDARVLDTLMYLGSLKGMPRAVARRAAMEWLERLELVDYAGQKMEKLSKGMQQKVQFVAAILHRPELIMLDEPFSGLDPINQDLFKGIVRELQDEGLSVLLSAHQMNMVEELCDSIFLIGRGRQVLYGSLQSIKDGYREHLVDLRYPRGEDPSFLRLVRGARVIGEEPGHITLGYSGGSINGLLGDISGGLTILEVTVRKPPLHDIFVDAVQERGEEA